MSATSYLQRKLAMKKQATHTSRELSEWEKAFLSGFMAASELYRFRCSYKNMERNRKAAIAILQLMRGN